MVLLSCFMEDPVKCPLRPQISTLISQNGHNLAGRKTFETIAVTHVNNGLAFRFRKLVGRLGPVCIFTIVR